MKYKIVIVKAVNDEWRKAEAVCDWSWLNFPPCGTLFRYLQGFDAPRLRGKAEIGSLPASLLCLWGQRHGKSNQGLFLRQRTRTTGLAADGMGRFADTTCKSICKCKEKNTTSEGFNASTLAVLSSTRSTLGHLRRILPPLPDGPAFSISSKVSE